jgi:hypothetical protein
MEAAGSIPLSQVLTNYSILSHIDPAHDQATHFPKIHLSISPPFTPGSSMWSLFIRFPQKTLQLQSYKS